jgi:hypothetical protein
MTSMVVVLVVVEVERIGSSFCQVVSQVVVEIEFVRVSAYMRFLLIAWCFRIVLSTRVISLFHTGWIDFDIAERRMVVRSFFH